MKGLIYGLFCKDDDQLYEFYIGSTWDYDDRKRRHKDRCTKSHIEGYHLKVYVYIREHGNFDNWDMVILDEVEVDNKQELRKIEGKYQIDMGSTLNRKIEGHFNKKEYDSQRQKRKKDEINAKRREKYKCECGRITNRSSKYLHVKTQKHQDYLKSKEANSSHPS